MCFEYESQVPCGISDIFLLQKKSRLVQKYFSEKSPAFLQKTKKLTKDMIYVDYHLIMHWK